MNITIDETHVFTFSSEEPSIGVWKNPKEQGRYGINVSFVGWINFHDWEQMNHFREMLDLALEKNGYEK